MIYVLTWIQMNFKAITIRYNNFLKIAVIINLYTLL